MRESLWQEPRWNAGRRAARKAAEVTEQRLTAFRFLFFLSFLRGPDERSEIRAAASEPDRDEAGYHHRIYLTKVGL
jgi:hypothetical protein